MTDFFTPPAGYGPGKLGALAVLSFVLAAVTASAALNPDEGLPEFSNLIEARGRVTSVSPHKYGVEFKLDGRAGTFDYPSKAGAKGAVESALATAGTAEVALLFDPKADTAISSADACYRVWQIESNGKSIRTFADSKTGWRSNNAIAGWLCGVTLVVGLLFSVLSRRAFAQRRAG